MEENKTPVKTYYKHELAALYRIDIHLLKKWIEPFKDEMYLLGYSDDQKIFTIAQVKYLFRDDVLGTP